MNATNHLRSLLFLKLLFHLIFASICWLNCESITIAILISRQISHSPFDRASANLSLQIESIVLSRSPRPLTNVSRGCDLPTAKLILSTSRCPILKSLKSYKSYLIMIFSVFALRPNQAIEKLLALREIDLFSFVAFGARNDCCVVFLLVLKRPADGY